jgi:hypothetical protein
LQNQRIFIGALSGLALVTASPAGAQLFHVPSIPKIGPQPVPAPPPGAAPTPGGGGAFFVDFLLSRRETSEAQLLLAKAFDLKDDVTLLEAEKTRLSSGALDQDGFEKSKELSESVNAKIAEKMQQGAVLSEEGAKFYQAAIPHLLKGSLLAIRLVPDAEQLRRSAQEAALHGSMFDKVKLAGTAVATARVAMATPRFVMDTTGAYKRVISYGQANKIPVPKDATDALGSL